MSIHAFLESYFNGGNPLSYPYMQMAIQFSKICLLEPVLSPRSPGLSKRLGRLIHACKYVFDLDGYSLCVLIKLILYMIILFYDVVEFYMSFS